MQMSSAVGRLSVLVEHSIHDVRRSVERCTAGGVSVKLTRNRVGLLCGAAVGGVQVWAESAVWVTVGMGEGLNDNTAHDEERKTRELRSFPTTRDTRRH